MNRFENVDDSSFIFGALLMIANKTDTLLDRVLSKYDITSKQWLLLLVIFNLFDHPPTIKEVANEMGSSHQNIKQVALKLEEKEMLKLEKDKKDLRATLLTVTPKSFQFWMEIANDGETFMKDFYANIDQDSISAARRVLTSIMLNLKTMEEKMNELP